MRKCEITGSWASRIGNPKSIGRPSEQEPSPSVAVAPTPPPVPQVRTSPVSHVIPSPAPPVSHVIISPGPQVCTDDM